MLGFKDFIANTMPEFLGGMPRTAKPGATDKVQQNLTALFNVMKILDPFLEDRNQPITSGTPGWMPPEMELPQIDRYSNLTNLDEDLLTHLLNVTKDRQAASIWYPVTVAFRRFLFQVVQVFEETGKMKKLGENFVAKENIELASRIDGQNANKVKRYVPIANDIIQGLRSDKNLRYLNLRKLMDKLFKAWDTFYSIYSDRSSDFFDYIENKRASNAHLKWDKTDPIPRQIHTPNFDTDVLPYDANRLGMGASLLPSDVDQDTNNRRTQKTPVDRR